jgi:RimJ/RimL family protein N-acetyltransferase
MAAILEPLECSISDVASVPRRFGVGVLMILMTAFAVLFAAMRTFRAPPEVFIIVAVLFLGVTLGQILLFQGKKPRQASVVVGSVVFPLGVLAETLFAKSQVHNPWETFGDVLCFSTGMLICTIPGGALFGYLAGCIMAGVFIVQERFGRRSCQPLIIELVPVTAADFDTLIAWVHHSQLFDLWARGRFRYPLDHEQLSAHLASGEAANRLCFKAVCGDMQEMVAYVELANIDREKLRASIELAIVEPSRNDRDRLSRALIWEIVQYAFNQQGMQWLGVVLHRSEAESLECFRKHGFYDAHHKTMGSEPVEYLKLIRSDRY